MNSAFYARLAFSNLSRAKKAYVPFIITAAAAAALFYNICALTFNSALDEHGSTRMMMSMGMWITAFFVSIFIFYTNSFLIKQRKSEIGLFNILGMEKKHIGAIMLCESLFSYSVSIISGLSVGVVLSRLITLSLCRLLSFKHGFEFEITPRALAITAILFAIIFTACLLHNLFCVSHSNPIELLRGSREGEKEPKTKVFTVIIGILTLGGGYAIALTLQNPLTAIHMFLIAAVLVIIGTYCLFSAGSIALLKLLRRHKRYYYQTRHFISVSGMLHRMRRNGASLGSICVISTAVLVMISTTTSLFCGIDAVLECSYPNDFLIKADAKDAQAAMDAVALLAKDASVSSVNAYSALEYACNREGSAFTDGTNNFVSVSNLSVIVFMSESEYARLGGTAEALGENEVLLYNSDGTLTTSFSAFGEDFRVKRLLTKPPIEMSRTYDAWKADFNCAVVSTQTLEKVSAAVSAAYGVADGRVTFSMSFNTALTKEGNTELCSALESALPSANIISRDVRTPLIYELYGSLLFLGIFLGLLFLMAAVLIIYYKQSSEGYEDKARFGIMRLVGLSERDTKASVFSQMLTVFALPLAAAAIHMAFAFPILTKLLSLLGLTTVSLFAICTLCTLLVFALIYCVIYAATARVYFKIVNN